MKVRLTAEEYSEHASLRARTPACRAPLLRRSLRLPLEGSPGNWPRDSLRLRRESVQPVVACAESAWPGGGSARPTRAFGEALRSEGFFVRSELRTRLRRRSAARGECEDSGFSVWHYEAAGSNPAAQELHAPAAYAYAHAHPAAEPTAATEPTGAPSSAEPAAPVPVPASAPGAGRQVGG
jgi:hypothetical protein